MGVIVGLIIVFVLARLLIRRPTKKTVASAAGHTPEIHADILRDGLNRPYELHYADYEGDETTRQIDVKTILGQKRRNGEPFVQYLRAYCHLRNDYRTFAIQRIEQAVDMQTGQVFDEQEWIIDHFKEIAGFHSDVFKMRFDPPKKITVYINNGYIFDYDMTYLEQAPNFLRTEGHGQRIDGKRKWSGDKRFYSKGPDYVPSAEDQTVPIKIEADGISYENFYEYLDNALGGNPKLKIRKAA